MPLIVGLGNPGKEYAETRHNVGFEVIDTLAAFLSVSLSPGKGPFYVGKGNYKGQRLLLVKPTTYMNRSGEAVVKALNWYKLYPDESLIIYDDLDLPIGKIRLRPEGSAGSHNGMKNIIRMTGTMEIPRLRIGIGNDFPKERQVSYVLSKFNTEERTIIDKVLPKARDAVLCYVREGIEPAMNKFN